MTPVDLTCREMADFLDDYLSGDLASAMRVVFDEHLAECPDCVMYLQTYEATIRLARDAVGTDPVPPTVPAELVQAILAARRPS